jgi:hypothetical protein
MPDAKVGYSPDAPKLTLEQLVQFKPAAYVRAPEAVSEAAPTRRRVVSGQ